MVAAITIGSALVGGAIQSDAAGRASNAQVDAANRNTAATDRQFQQTREDNAPFQKAGVNALKMQSDGLTPGGDFNRDFTMADYTKDPGFDFRFNNGRDAVEGSAAARGQLLSGGTLKALTQYGQDMGSQEFSNAYQRWNADRDRRFNRLATVAGQGQTATANTANFGAQAIESMNQSRANSADASAAGTVGQANAWSSGINGAANSYMSLNMLNRFTPQGGAAANPATLSPTMFSGGGYTPVA